MARWVNLYLIFTGIFAALVLAMPWLVIIGLLAFILPGMILGVMPTAFLWGLGFAIPWYLLRPILGDTVAIVPAVLIAAAVLWMIPEASHLESKLRLARTTADETSPASPIRLAGHVLLDAVSVPVVRPDPQPAYDQNEIARRPFVCDALCAALLATPGVESVTVTSHGREDDGPGPIDGHARTFRLVPKAQCVETTVRPSDPDQLGLKPRPQTPRTGFRDQLMRPRQAEWDVRLSTRDCIVADAPRAQYDFIIRKHDYRAYANSLLPQGNWSLAAKPVDVQRVEVTDGRGRPLLRKTLARTQALARPLYVGTEGGMENFRFQWGRTQLSNEGKRYDEFKPNQLLADHTNLRTDVDMAAIMKATRDRLAQALADPALPASDPAFKLSAPWLHSLEGETATDDDLRLLAKLIRDPRVTDFDGIWQAVRALGNRGRDLRTPLVERVATIDAQADYKLRYLGKVIDALPSGAFAHPTATEQAILADPERRLRAPGLISRQADRGAAAVPDLLGILDYHLRSIARLVQERQNSTGEIVAVDRVRMALCALGPDGSTALPVINRLTAEGLIDRRVAEDRDWQLMLARIGKPISEIPKPHDLSGDEAQFHRNLKARLDRFRPDRDCKANWT